MAEMNPQTPQKSTGKLKQMLSGKKIRRWIVLCVAAVAVIGGGGRLYEPRQGQGR